MTAGTSGYIAPEVTSGRFDNTIDIYSAGVVLYKMLGGEFPMDLSTLSPSVFPDFKKIIERATAVRSKRYTQAQQMLADIQAIGAKIIGPTIQSVAQAGEERILLGVTDITWGMLEPHFTSMKLASMRCAVTDLIKRVHWHVPAVTILDYVSLSGSMADVPAVVRACVALGTRVIVVNCPSESEAQAMIKYGAADCLPSLEMMGAIDTLKLSTETLITQVQMGSAGSWWKRILG